MKPRDAQRVEGDETSRRLLGVVCVALVSRFVLGERLAPSQLLGFGLLAVATVLITYRP